MRTKSLFYVCASITCLNALTSAAFSVAMLIGEPLMKTAAMYGVARSVPLALAALVATATRSYGGIVVLGLLLASVQACDAIVGWMSHDAGKTIGPLVLAVLTLVSVIVVLRNERSEAS
jgi:hypothetical protein